MKENSKAGLSQVLKKRESELAADWIKEQTVVASRLQIPLKENELKSQCSEFLRLFQEGIAESPQDISTAGWSQMRDLLTSLSRSRALQGSSASQTATFIFSFKKPLFKKLRSDLVENAELLGAEISLATELLDALGLFTMEVFQQTRENVILRQQEGLLELSTPVVILWDGILALPLIGTLDSARTQLVMQSLLQKIVETGAAVAIIDITGVPTVDTLVAQHLLKTVAAARLMGAECLISGIRPQIAQTIVHLGVNLGDVTTNANLKDAFSLALKRTGHSVVRTKKGVHSHTETALE